MEYLKKFSKEETINLSLCDHKGLLRADGALKLFMNIATEHAQDLGLGYDVLSPKHQYWIVVKNKLHFYRRPEIMEKVLVSTWPGTPDRATTMRYYTITGGKDGNERLAEGKAQWTLINTETGRLCRTKDVFPEGFEPLPDVVLPEELKKIRMKADEGEVIGRYQVRSVDIDMVGHMNNAKYAECILGAFSVDELEHFAFSDMEIVYLEQSYEGEELTIRAIDEVDEEGRFLQKKLGVFRPNGKAACTSILK